MMMARIRGLVAADELPDDSASLLSSRIADLPLDSLDLLTLAMHLEDDIGRVIEMDMLDEWLTVSELAAKFSIDEGPSEPADRALG